LTAHEIAPGTVRLDATAFASITPLDSKWPVIDEFGRQVTAGDGTQHFLVKDAERTPDFGSPDHRPFHIDFHPDGSAERFGVK
jgi:hypothetical protein